MNTESTDGADAEVLERLLSARHSCRAFLPANVPRPTIERVLLHAQRSASWCNAQPWQIAVVSGTATEQMRSALAVHIAAHPSRPDFDWPQEYHGVYQARRRECGFQLYAAAGIAKGDRVAADLQRDQNFRFFGAPHVAIVTTDAKLGLYGAVDCGAWVAAFMLSAQAHGVAAIAQAALAAYPSFWRSQLGLGEDRLVVCGVSFGYADRSNGVNQFRTSRASMDQSVQWID